MNILITGGAGYLGSLLIPKLLARGHKVRVIDIGYFGLGHLRFFRPPIKLIREDIRRAVSSKKFRERLTKNCDCIIHLAAISNDPSAELHPRLTEEVNFHATKALAETARSKGIKFIFSSSCSVYGEANGQADENSPVNALTIYAVSKVKAEEILKKLANDRWRPVILRNGTLFGYSPRMRFDLVANIFSLYSTLYNEIRIFGEGKEWRPFLHVGDSAKAFAHFAEKASTKYLCYNIAHENRRVIDVARIFKKLNPSLRITQLQIPKKDHRNYQASTLRMREEGFQTNINVEFGVTEITDAIVSGLIRNPESIYYRNAKWLKELTEEGKGMKGSRI